MLFLDRVIVTSKEIRLELPYTKASQLGDGGHVIIGATGDGTCPVEALKQYLAYRPGVGGPLYLPTSGRALVPSDVNSLLRTALPGLHISSRSLRIGAATAAGKKGLAPYVIQAAGRWHSDAYLRYVRLDDEDLQAVARVVTSHPQ